MHRAMREYRRRERRDWFLAALAVLFVVVVWLVSTEMYAEAEDEGASRGPSYQFPKTQW